MDSYVEINLDNIEKNVKSIKSKYNDYKYYIGVLKSDAYGHGEYIVNELVKSGINYIAVFSINDALNIRKYNKDIPILLLRPIDLEQIDVIIENNIAISINELDYLKKLIKLDFKNIKVHLKVDSGLNRLGINNKEELKEAYDIIKNSKKIELVGIYTHFATIGIFDKYWDKQIDKFKDITSLIDINSIPIIHLGSSITLLNHPKIDFANGIRIGTLLYGYNISYNINNVGLKNKLRLIRNKINQKRYNISKTITNVKIDLYPLMSFYTKILQIKKIKKGDTLGYGANFIAKKDMLIGIIPIGYTNGIGTTSIDRHVYINNKRYNFIGSIGMNMSFIEIDNNVNLNSKVVLLDNKLISLGKFSRFSNKTIHEMLLDIGSSNIRVYKKNNEIVYIDK